MPLEALHSEDPERLGPYRLLGRLGSGGMGRVFLARSPGGRLLAVKVIHTELADSPDFRIRFAREIAAARKVGGLFTAPVVDASVDGPAPWLATAYINGPSLAEAVYQHGPLPARVVLALAAGLAEGLGDIHAAGIVHRDLKPSNVLLAEDGPRVIDFGISRAAEATALTRTGLVVGTPGFMSPEQVEGGEIGPPSDVFGLGAVLVFASTGEGPFSNGPTMAMMYRVVHSQPRLDHVPSEVRPLAERCLAKEPADRPTASQILADLEAVTISAIQPDWLPSAVREMTRQPTVLADLGPRNAVIPDGSGASYPPDQVSGSAASERDASVEDAERTVGQGTLTTGGAARVNQTPDRAMALPWPPADPRPVHEPETGTARGTGRKPRRRLAVTAGVAVVVVLGSMIAISLAPSGAKSTSGTKPSAGASIIGTGFSGASFKACMVTDLGGINDKSYNQVSWQGMREAHAADPNISISYLQSTSQPDIAKNISAFTGQKCGIIVTVGFLMAPATQQSAAANPSQKFAIVDNQYTPTIPNVDALVFNTVQDAFLGGYLAAGMSKTGTVATYGGMDFGTVTIYMDGFIDGVNYYNTKHHAHVQVLGWDPQTKKGTFAGNFTSLADGQTIAQTFINEGADVILPVAGGVSIGTAQAVQAADNSGKHVSTMFVDTDGCLSLAAYCQYFITSITKGISTAVRTAVLAAASGHFKGGNYIGTLANGGVALAPYRDWASKIPAALQAEITQIGTQIQSGAIKPYTSAPVG